MRFCLSVFFFFNDTATTEIYTLSLHDALPICPRGCAGGDRGGDDGVRDCATEAATRGHLGGISKSAPWVDSFGGPAASRVATRWRPVALRLLLSEDLLLSGSRRCAL